jgi:hypothetical protein
LGDAAMGGRGVILLGVASALPWCWEGDVRCQ